MTSEKRAENPYRHELKYFINTGDMFSLKHRLSGALAPDEHSDENNEYFIRSLYFDDAYDSAYYDKLDGFMSRDKYRIRVYNLSDRAIFLERKRKMGDLIRKSTVRISRKLCDQLARGDPRGLDTLGNELLSDMYMQMRTRLLRPAVLVDYTREAFLHPAENTRITLDKHLRTGLYSKDLFAERLLTLSPLEDDVQILEVKYDSYLPDYISRLIMSVPTQRSSISKYALCRRFEPLNTF